MSTNLATIHVPLKPNDWTGSPEQWDWSQLAPLPPLRLAVTQQPANQQTEVRLCADTNALYVRFDCNDTDIWGTYTQHNDPIYNEEVVEVFLVTGEEAPTRYYEFEISPNGVLFEAEVLNPTSRRAELKILDQWRCAGLAGHATRDDNAHHWDATLTFPWAGLGVSGSVPTVWRGNFYRIERPRNGEPEYSCWSPTLVDPADFHIPARFGRLLMPSGLQTDIAP